jgi:hypothetical protein
LPRRIVFRLTFIDSFNLWEDSQWEKETAGPNAGKFGATATANIANAKSSRAIRIKNKQGSVEVYQRMFNAVQPGSCIQPHRHAFPPKAAYAKARASACPMPARRTVKRPGDFGSINKIIA